MIQGFKAFFDKYLGDESADADPQHQLQVATAALMVELMFADHEVSESEEQHLEQTLRDHFELQPQELQDLLQLAHEEKHAATDYYRFTSLINEHHSQQEKIELVEHLWRMAWADQRIDKFEEHLIRRLADLLHVPHAEFIQAKHRVTGC